MQRQLIDDDFASQLYSSNVSIPLSLNSYNMLRRHCLACSAFIYITTFCMILSTYLLYFLLLQQSSAYSISGHDSPCDEFTPHLPTLQEYEVQPQASQHITRTRHTDSQVRTKVGLYAGMQDPQEEEAQNQFSKSDSYSLKKSPSRFNMCKSQ